MGDEHEALQPPAMSEPKAASTGIPVARPLALRPVAAAVDGELLLLAEGRSAAWVDIGVLLLCAVAFELFVGGVVGTAVAHLDGWHDLPEERRQRALIVPVLSLRALVVTMLIAALVRHRGQSRRAVGLGRTGWAADLGLGCLATIVAYVLICLWLVGLWMLRAGVFDEMNVNAERLMGMVPRMSPLGFVLLSVLVGGYEELLFRGFLMPRLRRVTGSWAAAVLLSTLLFALLHLGDQEWIAQGPIAILSVVFSVVTIARRSLLPAIVGHALFDFTQFLWLARQAGDAWT